jgi:hypothetical protein
VPDLFVNTRTSAFPGGAAVAGVVVSLHSNTMLATGVTDAQGLVFLGNRAAGTYEIRVTPPPGSIPAAGSRQTVTLSAGDPGEVVFDVLVSTVAVSAPADPLLCRCHGYFKDPSGRPISEVSITFSEKQLPQLLLDSVTGVSTGLLPKSISVVTDSTGFASVDLVRGAQYGAFVAPLSNTLIDVVVPDLPLTSLPDVLFAVVDRIEYKLSGNTLTPTSAPTLSLLVGDTAELSVETVYRSGYRVEGLSKVSLFVEDDDKIKLSLTTGGNVAIQAVAAGSATVEVRRSETKEKTIYPEPTPKGFIAVTVT